MKLLVFCLLTFVPMLCLYSREISCLFVDRDIITCDTLLLKKESKLTQKSEETTEELNIN